MKKSEQNQYLRKLQHLKARLTGEVIHMADEAFRGPGGVSSQPNHLAELGTDAYEQDLTLQMIQSDGNVLGEINEAMDRLMDGSFGKCERCSKPIPKPRLDAIPYARYCVSCASALETGS